MTDFADGPEENLRGMLMRLGSLELAIAALNRASGMTQDAVHVLASDESKDQKDWNELLDLGEEIDSRIHKLRREAQDQRTRLNLALIGMLETGGREGSQ